MNEQLLAKEGNDGGVSREESQQAQDKMVGTSYICIHPVDPKSGQVNKAGEKKPADI